MSTQDREGSCPSTPHLLQHTRPLHFHCHLAAAILGTDLRPIHLPEAGSSNGARTDVGKHLVSGATKRSSHGLHSK